VKRNLYGLYRPSVKFVPNTTKCGRCMCYSCSTVVCELSDNYVRLHIRKVSASCVDDVIFLILTWDVCISQSFSTGVPPKHELKCACTHLKIVHKVLEKQCAHIQIVLALHRPMMLCLRYIVAAPVLKPATIKYCDVFAPCKNG
jgi:hypothetical protein